jgi:hypothetical protein
LDDAGNEGSGSDLVHYHVPLGGYTGQITIIARVHYQSLPPKWMDEMFAYSSAAIDTFETMYFDQDNTPVLIKEMEIIDNSVGIDDLWEFGVQVYPNPSASGLVQLSGLQGRGITEVNVYGLSGKLISSSSGGFDRLLQIQLPEQKGVYLIEVVSEGQRFVERVVRL